MTTYVPTVISFVALIYYCALLLIVIRRDIRRRLRLFFGLYLGSMIIWSFSAFMIFSPIESFNTLTWNRSLIVGSMAMPIAFFGFVQAFLNKERKTWLIVGVIGYAILQVMNLMGLIVVNAKVVNGLLDNTYGDGVILASIQWVFFIGFSSVDLAIEYRKTKDTLYRNRLKYLVLVILAIFCGTLTNLTELRSYPGDVAFNIISALLITYAILRHRLLDITIVLRKGLLYSIPTLLIVASYNLVIYLSLTFFNSVKGIQVFLISLVVAIITAFIVVPLRERTQNWIDRLFFREKYNASLMLQRISQNAAYFLDLQKLAEMILDEVTSTLHIKRAAFFIRNQDSRDFVLMAHRGQELLSAVALESSNPIVKMLEQFDYALNKLDLEVEPQLRSLWRAELKLYEDIGIDLLIPVKVKGELVGIFTAGPKLSGDTYSDDDQVTLTTLANQTAVAIENARLYSAEQSQREDLDSLYTLAQQLVVTDDVASVMESAVRNIIKSAHVTFARILMFDESGNLVCKAAFPIRELGDDLRLNKIEPSAALPFYMGAINQRKAILLSKSDPALDDEKRPLLMFNIANTICIYPFFLANQPAGIFVLGEARKDAREPFDADKLRLIGAIVDQTAGALQRAFMHEQVENSFIETVLALANAMDARDSYTGNHSLGLAEMAEATCHALGCSEEVIKAVHWAALLHDIGKIGVPDEILQKPGPLSEADWKVMKRHPEIGARIVKPVKKLANVAPIIRSHQEHYDGTGYPDGLVGEQIPFEARLIAIVDAYGAMIDDRVYRTSLTHEEAIAELRRWSGKQFDPQLVEVFIHVIEKEKLNAS
jgi:putative nucleotidyltransferase with HDIG domain